MTKAFGTDAELDPCPWCGKLCELSFDTPEIVGLPADSVNRWWFVRCRTCGCRGPVARPFGKAAADAWNLRRRKVEP